MHVGHKVGAWTNDFVQLFRGPIINEFYKEPPEHYLGYTLDGRVPVILIPGILNRWGYMKKLGNKISLLGHPVHIVPELGLNISNIPSSARLLHSLVVQLTPKNRRMLPDVQKDAEAIRKHIEAKNLKGIVLVAHSKGGLIGKYLLAHHNHDGRVLGLIAVATPFSGSALVKMIPHSSFTELKMDSKIISDLQKRSEVNRQIVSIYPEYDTHIWAPKGSYLEGAENIEVPVHGHSVLDKKEIQTAVLKAVEKITLRQK